MNEEGKRKFKENTSVYVVDHWGTSNGVQAFAAFAEIIQVDEIRQTFDAVLYGDTYNRYSFQDYGRLIFDTREEAKKAAESFPKTNDVIYQRIGKRVYKKVVTNITGRDVNGAFVLYIK